MSGLRFVFTHGFEQALFTPGRAGFQKAPGAGMCKASARAGPLSSSGLRPGGHQGMPLWHFKKVSLLDS
jgi:hypothetical protein